TDGGGIASGVGGSDSDTTGWGGEVGDSSGLGPGGDSGVVKILGFDFTILDSISCSPEEIGEDESDITLGIGDTGRKIDVWSLEEIDDLGECEGISYLYTATKEAEEKRRGDEEFFGVEHKRWDKKIEVNGKNIIYCRISIRYII
ncbi:MAG: hypothetical protein ACD_71C00010G0001, partial [uncultured bacterium (gcode 4)]